MDRAPLRVLGRQRRRALLAPGQLGDRRLRHGSLDQLAAAGVTSGPFFDWLSTVPVNVEGKAHQRQRRLVSKAFT